MSNFNIKGGRLANLGATFWLPLNPIESDLSGVEYRPDVILRNLLDISKYFPIISTSSSSCTNPSSSATSITNATIINNLQTRRRSSQFSYNGTTSTCDNEKHHQQHQRYNNKSRRGNSLPDIECMNSEAENSLDSICS